MKQLKLVRRFAQKYMPLFILGEICILATYTAALLLPLNTKLLVDEVLTGKNYSLLHIIVGRYAALFIMTLAFNLIYAYTWQTLNNKYVVDVKTSIFEKVTKAKAEYLSNMSVGDIMSRIDGDADQFIHVIQRNIFHFVNSIILCVGIVVILVKINIVIAVLVIIAAVLPIIATRLATRLTEKYSKEARTIFGKYIGRLFEMLGGMREIKLLSAEAWSRRSIAEPLDRMLKLGNSIRYTDFYVNKSVHLLNLLASLLIYGVSINLVADSKITAGMFFAAIEYIALLHKKFNWMLRIYLDWFNRKVSIDRVSEILNIEDEKDEGIEIENIKGLEFHNVTFSYGNEDVLKDLSFRIKGGEHVGIAGISGVGKTTIAGLMMKFYEPQKGNISVNGSPVSLIRNSSLRRKTGWVGQDVILFNDTLRFNLTLGNEDIQADSIKEILKEKWLDFLPGDLDTKLGTGGVNLSGGQKQLLSIARVLLKKPALIIFDEVTANLDENTEKEILQYIRRHYGKTTIIYISHRPNTVKQCDRIIVLKDGTVEGIGSHESLMKLSKEYMALFGRKGA